MHIQCRGARPGSTVARRARLSGRETGGLAWAASWPCEASPDPGPRRPSGSCPRFSRIQQKSSRPRCFHWRRPDSQPVGCLRDASSTKWTDTCADERAALRHDPTFGVPCVETHFGAGRSPAYTRCVVSKRDSHKSAPSACRSAGVYPWTQFHLARGAQPRDTFSVGKG